jgi:hypothetical protein
VWPDTQTILEKQEVIPVSKTYPSPLANFPFTQTDPAKVIELGGKWTQIYQDSMTRSGKPARK